MCVRVEYSSGCVYRVGYDNDFGDVIDGTRLIDTAPNSKEFGFCTCDEGSMMNSFDNWLIKRMDVRYGRSNIILDASVHDYKSSVEFGRAMKSHFV